MTAGSRRLYDDRVKYTREVLQRVVRESFSLAEVLTRLGFKSYSGSTSSLIRRRIEEYELNTSHFRRGFTGKFSTKRKAPSQIFTPTSKRRLPTVQLRRALLESGVEHKCEACGQGPKWNGKPLTLPIDHRDGDWSNNDKDNLRFLCPNCHSQTSTYGTRKLPAYASGEAAGLSRQ